MEEIPMLSGFGCVAVNWLIRCPKCHPLTYCVICLFLLIYYKQVSINIFEGMNEMLFDMAQRKARQEPKCLIAEALFS